ncbi:hypothetical protein PR202_gb22005 [Eleusine coracana subsp. coracana]|uniref:Acyl-CoA dehydrogenase family member 11 n=1 Tax=Eleusine coracana subsp. coracana TaxID=191504 RepID=A0AAV5FET4_ELECO|nr:hypothetical protein PR202_gb22005 [Eleusine coracana subsp. coracana]
MAKLTSELLRPVDAAHALNETALLRYAAANVPGFPTPAPTLNLTQFGHGQSNPTYCLEASARGGETKRYVLRKKPPGAILQSAHAVEREFQSVTPAKRQTIYFSAAETLASIHKVDVNAIGLQKYGRRDNYCKRQVERWERQYLSSTGEGKPARYQKMLDLAGWLKENLPAEDSSAGLGTGLVHGDYRVDNLIFHPTEDRVIGVLDWELSTLGNQMCDVAYSCLGNASGGERAKFVGRVANVMVDRAWDFINRANVLGGQPAKGIQTSKAPWQEFGREQKGSTSTRDQGRFVPSEKLDSAARARKLLFEDHSLISPGSSNDLLLGAGLTNLEYGYLCEIMGRSIWAPQIFNCGAPDTGNMEVLLRYGTKEQQKQWLVPLLEGKIRSGFAMTEPRVASSDATNIECSISRQGDFYVINGRKWWTSGAMDPRCKILILMGKTDFSAPKHKQQSMILVDINTPGVHIKRPLLVFGFDDAPHGHAEITFDNVRVPVTNILLGEGRGFEIAQGRLGPGRLHHCMRLVGAAERGMDLMIERALSRTTFGKRIAQHGSFQSDLAKCRIELEQARLLVLEAADQLDRHGNKKARGILAMAKVAAPNMALKVLDMAMQVHGAAGLSSDTVLSHLWATARTLRIADGPDEVHLGTIAKLELQRARL